MKKSFIIMIFVAIAMMSCESKSGQLASKPFEKIVIIDATPLDNESGVYHYKVKRLTNSTVTWIYDLNLYERGDTILKRITYE